MYRSEFKPGYAPSPVMNSLESQIILRGYRKGEKVDYQPLEQAASEPEQRPDAAEHSRVHLSVAQAIGLIIVLVVLQMFISTILSRLDQPLLSDEGAWPHISLTHLAAGLLTAKAGAILAGLSLGALLLTGFSAYLAFPLLAAMLGISILSSELNNLLQSISPISELYVEVLNRLFQQNVWGVLLAVGVVAPTVEELIFRGVMLEGLRIRYKTSTAILISSLLFAVVHLFPWVILNAFLLGLFFSWLKIRTGSLLLCIIAHSIYNSLPFLLMGALSIEIPGYNTMQDSLIRFQPWWFDLAGAGLLAGGMWGVHSIIQEQRNNRKRWALEQG